MIDTIEEMQQYKKIYVFNKDSYTYDNAINYVQYSVAKIEYRSFNKWFVQLKHSARKSKFPKTYNITGSALMDRRYEFHSSVEDVIRSYCRLLKYKPEKNAALFEKLKEMYPQHFI